MDIVILLSIAATVVLLLVTLAIFKSRSSSNKVNDEQPQERQAGRREAGPGARRRALAANRNARAQHRAAPQDSEGEGDEPPVEIELPDGKVGAKKMAKLQAKAEKKAHREAEEKTRMDRKKQQEKADEERKQLADQEKQEEERKAELERKAQEEKERREHEEYLKLKEAFAVEEEGFEGNEEEGDNLLQEFVDFIKNNKVVVLEDIAARFKLKTQQAIERIQQLQADGTITGVIDDRGKFIFVSPSELDAVAKFVMQRGRVSISELVDNSNMLINLTPNLAAAAST